MNHNLAIIIPYFKIEFFEKTLESLAQQTDKRFNVYIGDDASPNSPKDLLEKYLGKFNFKYQRFDENLGGKFLTKQWERCIDLMEEEEWFMILGDDDLISTNVVNSFYQNLSNIKRNSNVVSFQFNKIDEDNNLIGEFLIKENYINPLKLYADKLLNKTMTSLSQFIFSKKKYNKYKFINLALAWGSDDLAYMLFSENKNIYIISENVYIRYSTINISGDKKYFVQKHLAILDFYQYLFYLKGSKLKGEIKDIIFNEYFYKLLTYDAKLDKSRFVKFLYYVMRYDINNLFRYLKPLIALLIK